MKPAPLLKLFRLKRWQYFADFFITPPLTGALVALSLSNSASLLWPVWFGTGLLAWSLYEYLIHRFILHRLWLFRAVHGLHHDRPKDYIAMPPWATVIGYVFFWYLFGLNSTALAVGFSTGYVTYSALHTLFHYARFEHGWLSFLRQNHLAHHWHGTVNFGVTSPLFDVLFGTYRRAQ